MAGIIEKKGKILGTGTPLICVPVTEETKEKIVEEIRILTEQKVDMIEWRMANLRFSGSGRTDQ